MGNRLRPLIALIVLALFSSACAGVPWAFTGPDLLAQAPTLAPAPPTPTFWDFPRGRFSAIGAPSLVVLSIENDGSYQVYQDSGLLDAGKFEIVGTRIVVDSVSCAKRGYKPAAYEWAYGSEQVLAFQAEGADPCSERQGYLTEIYQPKYVFVYAGSGS